MSVHMEKTLFKFIGQIKAKGEFGLTWFLLEACLFFQERSTLQRVYIYCTKGFKLDFPLKIPLG